MTKHFSEADLLETYYMQPGESMPVMMHLADCSDCAARYERLERKLREAAACDTTPKPETFWTRQRMSIMRRVESQQHAAWSAPRISRAAAATLLAFFLGGAVTYEISRMSPPQQQAPVTTAQSAAPKPMAKPAKPAAEEPMAHDAWQSDELQDFHIVVQWETWVDDAKTATESSL